VTVVDYPDFATPQAHASAIAITGAPLLTLAGILQASNTFTIAGGATQTIGPLTIMQLGYEIQLKLSIPAGATVPFVDVVMQWTDATGGSVMALERWMLPCGSAANYVITGTGPTKGSSLTVKLVNQDPAQTATVTVIILTNSRVYTRDRWITNTVVNVPTFTNPGGDPTREVLATMDAANCNAGATITRLIPPYAGDVWFYVEQSGVSAANSVAKLQAVPTAALGTADFYSSTPTGGAGTGNGVVLRFPRSCALFSFTNSGSVAATVSLKAIMLDDRY
jgi:hypothetical protein